jgi:hypothetical protein
MAEVMQMLTGNDFDVEDLFDFDFDFDFNKSTNDDGFGFRGGTEFENSNYY